MLIKERMVSQYLQAMAVIVGVITLLRIIDLFLEDKDKSAKFLDKLINRIIDSL